MITRQHLKVYDDFNADEDLLAESGSEEEKELFSKNEFETIHSLIENQYLIDHVKTSKEFIQNHEAELDALLEDPGMRKDIIYLSKKYVKPDKSVIKNLKSKIGQFFKAPNEKTDN